MIPSKHHADGVSIFLSAGIKKNQANSIIINHAEKKNINLTMWAHNLWSTENKLTIHLS